MAMAHTHSFFFEHSVEHKKVKKMRHIVKESSLLTKNEIQISDILKEIPRYFIHFDTIIKYRDFKIAEIDDECFEKCESIDNSKHYLLFQYDSRENIDSFSDFLSEKKDKLWNKKKYVSKIIHSFKDLINIVKILDEKKIVHLNIVPQSILFRKNNLPVLTNFHLCFLLDDADFERKSIYFSIYDPRRFHLPLEFHLLSYIIERGYDSLSFTNIETVVDHWYNGLSLSGFGKYITGKFKDAALFSQRRLINKPRTMIINDLLSTSHTWNNYSLSIIFLHFVSSLDDNVYPHTFTSDFSRLLLNNISGNHLKRETAVNTSDEFDTMVMSINEEEWTALFSQI